MTEREIFFKEDILKDEEEFVRRRMEAGGE